MDDQGARSSTDKLGALGQSVFELQAYMDLTKHMGGLRATNELLKLCNIDQDKVVLDVGCGVGQTPAYIASRYGCRVVGADITPAMIERARERAKREGVEDKVELRVANALDLPFDDDLFDIVLCESVVALIGDKARALGELVRVAKPGGYVGLNETHWAKVPPPELAEMISSATAAGTEIPTAEGWVELLEGSGLRDVVVRSYEVAAGQEAKAQLGRYRLTDVLRSLSRVLALYLRNPAYREWLKENLSTPKEMAEYLGYGIYVGRKQGS